ncbi:MAG TPA: hypothetical protein VK890_02560 [Bacteroidia bacterium]|jgi:hypothetical protein|nr:hypothetical protein [Bacteroidia bacterium]
MATLNSNWLTEKCIDFEYKKYILLAFLQDVDKDFEVQKLYPSLRELITHYRQLVTIKEKKDEMYKSFPQSAKDIDAENMRIMYQKMVEDSEIMKELDTIVDFSIPQFQRYLTEGRKIYDAIESQLNIFPVGVVPIHAKEGYIFIRAGKNADTCVYEYDIALFEEPEAKYRGIHTQFVKSREMDLGISYQYIKLELIKEKQDLPNPATYAIESEWVVPLEETLLPIAKRCLLKYVERNAA